MPLCLPQIPHTSDMIMETIQGNRIPIETAVVADEVKKSLLSQYRRKLIRMFNKVCQITCRETPGFGLQFQIVFFKTRFNIILQFNCNYFQQSLTITFSITNFVYISSYKVGDSTDLPFSKLPLSLAKGFQCDRLDEFLVAGPLSTARPVFWTGVRLSTRERVLYISQ